MKKILLLIGFVSLLLCSTAWGNDMPTLTVYSYDSFTSDWGAGPKLKQNFEKQYKCHVKFITFEDGVTMFNRLRLEGDAPGADVIVGLDNNLLKDAQASNLFAENHLDLADLTLPIVWKDQWFIPYDYGQYAFIYDKSKLVSPPTSLKELIENQNFSVIYQDPRTSTVGRGLLAWVNTVYGKNAVKAWEQLAQHTVTVGKGWSETYGAFLKGESDLVLSYNTSPLYHQINEKKNNYTAAVFSEGHIVQIELAARLKASTHAELAEKFLAFLLQPESQKTIALKNVMLPVIKTKVAPQYDSFIPAKTLAVPQPDKKTSRERLRVWQRAVSR